MRQLDATLVPNLLHDSEAILFAKSAHLWELYQALPPIVLPAPQCAPVGERLTISLYDPQNDDGAERKETVVLEAPAASNDAASSSATASAAAVADAAAAISFAPLAQVSDEVSAHSVPLPNVHDSALSVGASQAAAPSLYFDSHAAPPPSVDSGAHSPSASSTSGDEISLDCALAIFQFVQSKFGGFSLLTLDFFPRCVCTDDELRAFFGLEDSSRPRGVRSPPPCLAQSAHRLCCPPRGGV